MAYYTKDSIYSQISDGDVEDWSHNLRSSMQPRPGLTNRLRPPKLVTKMYKSYNRNQLTDTGVSLNISFKNNDSVSEAELTSLHYNYFQTNFTCISKIGEGSFGEVFNVKSKEDGRMYAVKISKEVLRGGRYRKERLEEARLYKQFSGKPNCLTVYRAWQQHERLYIQMELCKGNLQNYLDKKKELPERMIWSIFLDILIALKSLHDNNLIHLDIKTENVLISDDGSCKLADFGLVADVDKANRECVMEGDARYVAPEIMRGIFSKSADIFSLGITILKLAGNKHLPPNSQRWVQIRSGLLPDNVLKNLGISLELQQVLKEMISADQATRPSVDILLQHKKFRYFKMQKLFWKNIQQTVSLRHLFHC
ncbi:membrane-associated tyrosine- and threonine-specific cdc2-inhibitory kinase-like [Teleopsis dalmanni]|uniref:membrane-associated tyrosine- and threonine-specific cdc2-inhibitory kinase-like n=1 Tax=Teleopsis dalmanni TaxID=139649 RepID=UPI0018CD75FF|nr:membrane-associated tyrosine- and threonine-specific cdc2-inhibitory kinase-like [Teleopsis dalmanni]